MESDLATELKVLFDDDGAEVVSTRACANPNSEGR